VNEVESSVEVRVADSDLVLASLIEMARRRPLSRAVVESLSSSLAQYEDASRRLNEALGEPVRTIHHFACTGGSLITKCLTCLPNVLVLSEVDPLSTLQPNRLEVEFAPTDVIRLLGYNAREVDDALREDVFLSSLLAIQKYTTRIGQRLLVRDHSHSRYCTDLLGSIRYPLLATVQRRFDTRSVVTVRHPLDSFVSLRENGWLHFRPGTLEEYCRRYLVFLDDHESLQLFRYEDFVSTPSKVLEDMSGILDLPFTEDYATCLSVVRLTGDSGRSGSRISVRERRPVSEDIKVQADSSRNYEILCGRLGYEPDED
jgi:hypothetical protein